MRLRSRPVVRVQGFPSSRVGPREVEFHFLGEIELDVIAREINDVR